MLHKPLAFLMVVCLLAVSLACGPKAEEDPEAAQIEPQIIEQAEQAGQGTQIANPIVEVADASAFAPLGIRLNAPAGASDVRCSIISGTIAQIDFAYEDRAYTYRAASTNADIAGVYETFDEEVLALDAEGADWYANLSIKTIEEGKRGALVQWMYPPVQYTLYCANEVDVDELAELSMSLASEAYPRAEESVADVERKLLAMHPILDSVLRCIGIEGETAWSPTNASCVWNALYLMGANWGETDERVRVEGGKIVVPTAVMREWAYHMTGADTLLDIPKDMDMVQLDTAKDAYVLDASDMGESETRMDYSDKNADGSYQVLLGFYLAEGTRNGGLLFILTDAQDADGAFAYTVRSVAHESLDA